MRCSRHTSFLYPAMDLPWDGSTAYLFFHLVMHRTADNCPVRKNSSSFPSSMLAFNCC